MRIGIVTPAFNVAPYIGETIGSVLAQTHRDWTMVVVDDGSTDGTASVVRKFADPRLRLISQANAGVSAARNCGAASMACDATMFLDGDDWLAPFALHSLAEALSAAPNALAAMGAYERGGRVYPPASGSLLEQLLVRNLFVNGGHVLIRQAAVQPFQEDLRYGEDWEFWVRLLLPPTGGNDDTPMAPPRPAGGCRHLRISASGTFPAVGPGMRRDDVGASVGEVSAMTMVSNGDSRPILHVRECPSGAYLRMATDPTSFNACLDAIHGNPALPAIFHPEKRAALRRQADAEVQWTIGRELIRHRRYREGLSRLGRSLAQAPTLRRAALLAAIAVLPPRWRGPLYPYDE